MTNCVKECEVFDQDSFYVTSDHLLIYSSIDVYFEDTPRPKTVLTSDCIPLGFSLMIQFFCLLRPSHSSHPTLIWFGVKSKELGKYSSEVP